MTEPERIPASVVKQLREETGAGMMDCKRALVESGGDVDRARQILRERGLASAGKREGRAASEGGREGLGMREGKARHDRAPGGGTTQARAAPT